MPLGIIRFLFVFRESVKLLKLFENVQCRWGDSKIYCIYYTIRTNRVPAQQKSLTMVVRIQWRIFSEILTYKRTKNSLFECKWGGGGGCRKFESFVGNLEGFAPHTGKSEFPPLREIILNQTKITLL